MWTWSFLGSKFACRRLADRHAAARISDSSWTFSKIPSLGAPREQCPVGKPVFRHFGSMGAFLLAENCGKFQLFHVSGRFRAPPRTLISVKIRFFWLKMMSFQYGFITNFNRADWPTVEGARAVRVDLVVFRFEVRPSTIGSSIGSASCVRRTTNPEASSSPNSRTLDEPQPQLDMGY